MSLFPQKHRQSCLCFPQRPIFFLNHSQFASYISFVGCNLPSSLNLLWWLDIDHQHALSQPWLLILALRSHILPFLHSIYLCTCVYGGYRMTTCAWRGLSRVQGVQRTLLRGRSRRLIEMQRESIWVLGSKPCWRCAGGADVESSTESEGTQVSQAAQVRCRAMEAVVIKHRTQSIWMGRWQVR